MKMRTVNIYGCARCGKRHKDMQFKELTGHKAEYNYWAMCPVTKEPILLVLK
jgi:hypothetical protein